MWRGNPYQTEHFFEPLFKLFLKNYFDPVFLNRLKKHV